MRTKRTRRNSRKTRADATVEIVSPAGRWILLPGGGFGLLRPCSFENDKTPA